MSDHSRPSLRPSLAELDALRRKHPRWLIDHRSFADGPRFDARQLGDPEGVRLVTETADEMGRQIAAVENGSWCP